MKRKTVGAVDKILMAILTLGIAAEAGAQVKTVDPPPLGTYQPSSLPATHTGRLGCYRVEVPLLGGNLNCASYRGTTVPMTIQKLGPFDDGSWLRTVDVCEGVPSSDLPPAGYVVTETVAAFPPGSCGRLQYTGRWRTPPWRAVRVVKLP